MIRSQAVYPLAYGTIYVLRTGIEPVIFGLKTQRFNLLI